MTSRTYSIRLTANLRAQVDSGDPVLSFGYLTSLLASRVIEIIAIFCENNPILRKFDLFWPPVTSNLTWSKNDPSIFCRTCHSLSNAVYRLSLSFLVFEFSGGGGAVCEQITYRAEVSERETRASLAGSLQLPRVRTEHGRRSFPYWAVAAWNKAHAVDRATRTWVLLWGQF